MATSTLAMGDVQIAARDGHEVPHGTGLGPDGKPSDDPAEILKGVLLPFGGYKGSAIALMITMALRCQVKRFNFNLVSLEILLMALQSMWKAI